MPDVTSEIERMAAELGGTVSVSVRNISNALDFALNDDVRLGSASTIKVPILIEALTQVRDGRLALETEYTVSRDQCRPGSGVLTHLHDGLTVTLQDVLTLMIITSDNTATNMAIDAVGIDDVNSMLRGFGYTGTTLMRKMYDWEAQSRGKDNWIVAREITDLLVRIARDEAVGGEFDKLILSIMRKQLYCDELGLFLPEGVLANKTGQVHNVVHDCGVVTTPEFCYAIAVLTGNAPVAGEAKVAIGRISRLIYDTVSAGKTC